jgi:hypothetical protein
MTNDYEPWPDLITPNNLERLLLMFPLSKLLHLQKLSIGSPDRAEAWADLGITDPTQQAQLELDLEKFINKLTKDHTHA